MLPSQVRDLASSTPAKCDRPDPLLIRFVQNVLGRIHAVQLEAKIHVFPRETRLVNLRSDSFSTAVPIFSWSFEGNLQCSSTSRHKSPEEGSQPVGRNEGAQLSPPAPQQASQNRCSLESLSVPSTAPNRFHVRSPFSPGLSGRSKQNLYPENRLHDTAAGCLAG